MITRKTRVFGMFLLFLVASSGVFRAAHAGITHTYLHTLSNFTGVIPFTWVRVVANEAGNEAYVADGGSVHIFSESGMETYRFGDDPRLGSMYDIAPLANGDLLLLSHFADGSGPALMRCNYRGEFLERRPLKGLSEGWSAFRPSRMVVRGETLYLADLSAMKVVVLDLEGFLQKTLDLAALLKLNGQQVADSGLGGFDVDDRGSLYFTIPTQFQAYRLSPEGGVASFGQPGSSPGKFGVIAGIAADRSGNVYVVDTLKCVVMAFDKELRFLTEFGYRTARPGGLVAPRGVTVSADGKLYITQQGKRGVSVYRARSN